MQENFSDPQVLAAERGDDPFTLLPSCEEERNKSMALFLRGAIQRGGEQLAEIEALRSENATLKHGIVAMGVRTEELELTNRNLIKTCEDRENAAQAYFADQSRGFSRQPSILSIISPRCLMRKLRLAIMAGRFQTEALKEASLSEWTKDEKRALFDAINLNDPKQAIAAILAFCE